jgi:hypothetical protein
MKQFIITEQEKYNILKQYGLFEQSSRTIPTWSYSETKLPTSKIVEINFPFNQTKEVIINNKYNLGIKFFRNLNTKVGINVPDKIAINSIKLIDNSNKSYTINEKSNTNYYMPQTGPFAAPPPKKDWDYFISKIYEPEIKIPGIGIKMSFVDIVTTILSLAPNPYAYGAAVLLDISSIFYFIKTDDKYEAGLRAMLLFIPLNDLPFVRAIGKKVFIKLLKILKDISKNISAVKRLGKKEFNAIIQLSKEFFKNGKNIYKVFKKAIKNLFLFIKLVKATSALKLKDFLFMLYKYNKSNPTSFAASSKKILFVLIKMFAKIGIIISSWDELWELFASNSDKQKHTLKKDLDSVNNQSMGDLSFSTKFELFNQVGENLDLTDYVLSQT